VNLQCEYKPGYWLFDATENQWERHYEYMYFSVRVTACGWKWIAYKHDGLPLRILRLGWLEIRWGKTHEFEFRSEAP
jgi:hypothetical protein